jgi:hypothetical protein
MSHLSCSWAVCFLAFLAIGPLGPAACASNTLDGGSSKTDGGAGGTSGAPGAGDTIPSTAVTGTVNGSAFVPQSIEVGREAGRWFFTLRSYASTCGLSSGPLTGPDLAVVTIGDIATTTGTESIAAADGHGATFQTGVFEQGKGQPIVRTVSTGSLRFDSWSETPGATITGGLKLVGEGSDVEGTFTATVCPPRG